MDILDKIIWAESGGNPNGKNPHSSATGLGQFIDGTWVWMIKRHRPDLAKGKSDADLTALKSDPDLSRQMTAAYLDDNSRFLKRKGLPVTDGTEYLAHFAGPGGAVRILTADPSTPAAALLGPDFAKENPKLAGYTAGQLASWADQRMAAATTSLAGAPPAPQQNRDVPPAGDARRPQPRFPQRGEPIPYLAQTQGVGPMPGAAETGTSVQNLDQTIAAQRTLDKGAFGASPNAPPPDARYLVRVPSPANSAAGGSARVLSSNAAPSIAPTPSDDRFGNWPSSSQASAPARPTTTAPDAQRSSDGGKTGFGIYKYPTEDQLGFDPSALSVSPRAAAPPDARYLVRVPSPQTSEPAQPVPPQQPGRRPEEGRPLPFPVPPMVYGLPDPSTAAGDNMDDWFDRWIKPLRRP
jgi:hypothetical protein